MQFDSYAPCPCGSGKKIKFCCSKDLLHELEKILRALHGEQYVSALDQTSRLMSERGPRAALLAIQAETFLALDQIAEADQAAAKLLEIMPHSSVGLAVQAISDVLHGQVDAAVEHLQQSIENINEMVHSATATAMTVVAQALLHDGRVMAARGHLLMRAGLSGGEDREAVSALMDLNRIERLPTMMKQDFQYAECPPGVPWHGEFEAAMKSARRGAWLAACESLESLDQKAPYQPAVLRNIAILRSWLGQNDEACKAWRKYNTLPGLPEDDAVEAEAVCQILSRGDTADLIDSLKITYHVKDTDQLMERLLSDKRVDSVPVNPQELVEEGEPPPKGVFKLLDRPLAASQEGLQHTDLPVVIGDLLVFGKQTDRPARLEFEVERSPRLEQAKAKLIEVVGELVGPPEKEEVQGQLSRLQFELNPEIRLPQDVTQVRAMELLNAQRDYIYSTIWPDLPRSIFAGKSARQAAQDPNLRVRVLAAILNLELASDEQPSRNPYDFDRLRRELGLAARGTFEVHREEILSTPTSRLARLKFKELSDEELVSAFRLAILKLMRSAIRNSAKELVARPSVASMIDMSEVYRVLVGAALESDEALEYIASGRKIAAEKRQSPAAWYLMELQVRLTRQEPHECNRLIKLIATRHAKEPGVAEGLQQILVRFGVISPDGKMMGEPAGEAGGALAAPASAPPSGLWTPDSPAPKKEESKLWLPGM